MESLRLGLDLLLGFNITSNMAGDNNKNKVSTRFLKLISRPKPSAPKSGLKDSRYGEGGKISRKKNS